MLPANSAAPWKLVELNQSRIWLLAKGQAQMASTVGVQKAGRPTMGSEEGAERRLHEAQSPDQEGIIHSFIHSTTIDCMFCWAGCYAESYRHMGQRVILVNCLWLHDSHSHLGSCKKAGSERIQNEMHSGCEVSPEFCFGENVDPGPTLETLESKALFEEGDTWWSAFTVTATHPTPSHSPRAGAFSKEGGEQMRNFLGPTEASQLFHKKICGVWGGESWLGFDKGHNIYGLQRA